MRVPSGAFVARRNGKAFVTGNSGFPKSHSCLKPAHEVWWLAKAPGPLQPLQIDACRVATGEIGAPRAYEPRQDREQWRLTGGSNGSGATSPAGRWPPNTLFSHVGGPDGCQPAGVRCVPADKRGQGRPRGTFPHSDDAWGNGHRAYTGAETAGDGTEARQEYRCVDGCPIKALDAQAGPRTSGGTPFRRAGMGYHGADGQEAVNGTHGDTGSASRFFPTFPGPDPEDAVPFRYQPKASRAERNAGCEGLPAAAIEVAVLDGDRRRCRRCGKWYPKPMRLERRPASTCICPEPDFETLAARPSSNGHPTVKPLGLMAWLCKLVTPEGGVVLDPFCGSGSTLVACVREGFGFIGIEQSAEYVAIARARIAHEQEQRSGPLFAGVGTSGAAR